MTIACGAEPVESVPAPFDKLRHIPQLAVCWFHASQDCVRHGVRLRLGQPVASLQFDDLIWTDDVVCRQLDGTSGESEVMPAPDVGGRHLDQPDGRSHGERHAAVPVEGAGERTRLCHRIGITINKLLWQAVIEQ